MSDMAIKRLNVAAIASTSEVRTLTILKWLKLWDKNLPHRGPPSMAPHPHKILSKSIQKLLGEHASQTGW
jgi:hypothetical protein